MNRRRTLFRVACLALLLLQPLAAAAQGDGQITVQVSPNELPARPDPNAQAQVSISINIPTTVAPGPGDRPTPGDPGEPFFTVAATPSGTLTPDPQYPAPTPFRGMPGNPLMFEILRPRDGGTRTSGEAHYLYKPAPDPEPGEVIITVEGGQGLTLGGVGAQGTTRFRGQGRLILTAVPGGRQPRQPLARPPFTPTSGAVNPPDAMIKRLGPLVLLLGGLALTHWAVTRPPRVKRKKPEIDLDQPEPPPDIQLRPGECLLEVCASEGPHLGNGEYEIHFQARAVPSPGWAARFLGPVKWGAKILPPGRLQPDAKGSFHSDFNAADYSQVVVDPDPPAFPPLPPGGDPQYYKLRLPWEWRDLNVSFSATASAQLTAPDGTHKPLGPITGSGAVRIEGANPEIVISPKPAAVNATGRDRTELEVTSFVIFGETKDPKQVRVVKAGVLDPTAGLQPGSRPAGGGKAPPPASPWKPGKWWNHLVHEGARAFWVPPFLLQEPGHAETVDLEARCVWKRDGGEPLALPPTDCEVTLRGCQVEARPLGTNLKDDPQSPGLYFLPLPGAKLRVHGELKCGVTSVNDPFGKGAVHAPGAGIACEVRDLSQGIPSRPAPHLCKRPAGQPFDVDFSPASGAPERDRQVQEKIDQILAQAPQVPSPQVFVGPDGRLCTGNSPNLVLWEYAPQSPEHEPIDNGPVVYTLTVKDGLDGSMELRGALYALLGRLVMETGGPDFRIYEYRPYLFDLSYDHPLNYFPNMEVELRWEFAFVDRDGNPVCSAMPRDPVVTSVFLDRPGMGLPVGHMLSDRDTYLYRKPRQAPAGGPEDGEVRSVPQGSLFPVQEGWRQVEAPERDRSLALCRAWHAKWEALTPAERARACVEEPGLPWLRAVDPIPWEDQTLFMAVRVEMWKDGHLLATSDRVAPAGLAGVSGGTGYAGRTLPDYVWRDHQFRFVLLALRLRLQDDTGQPYAERPYLLKLPQREIRGKTGVHGQVEQVIAPEEEGKLLLLSPAGQPNGAEFDLRLGSLDPVSQTTGVVARLNNLGLFAGKTAAAPVGDTYRRAVERFETLRRLDPTGYAGDPVRRALEEAHDRTGAVRADRTTPVPRVLFQEPAQPPVAKQRSYPTHVEDPDKPGPPEILARREACVALHQPNTLRVPGDPRRQYVERAPGSLVVVTSGPPAAERDRWFVTDKTPARKPSPVPTPPMQPVREGNEVRYLIDGRETFEAMVAAIRLAQGPSDYIYLLGWYLDLDFQLIPGDDASTLRKLLAEAAGYTPALDSVLRCLQKATEGAATASVAAAEVARIAENVDDAWRARRGVDLTEAALHASQAALRAADAVAAAGGAVHDAARAADYAARAALDPARRTEREEAARLARAAGARAESATQAARTAHQSAMDEAAAQRADLARPSQAGKEQIEAAARAAREAADAANAAVARVADCARAIAEGTPGEEVQVRAVLFKNRRPGFTSQNAAATDFINLLTDGAAFRECDVEGLPGSHHQKLLVVGHQGQLTAFCGGLDINPDRLLTYQEAKAPLPFPREPAPFHDVHCRIRGPAAHDLLRVFVQRWDHQPTHAEVDRKKGDLRGRKDLAPPASPVAYPGGRQVVQIGRTFGNVSPPNGGTAIPSERTAWRMIRQAIREAQRFIYLEDQYLTSEECSRVLSERLAARPLLEHVTILIPRDAHTDLGKLEGTFRFNFLDPLLARFRPRVRVFILDQPAGGGLPEHWHTYIHTKMWIVDDRFAIIGTANCCRRSFTYDSEVVAGIFDESTEEYCAYHFAHQLRIAVWAEHLNMDTPEGHAELADGVASGIHWLRPPPGARIRPYDVITTPVIVPTDPVYDFATVDPQGSGPEPPDP